jgi:glycosyl transferase family 25
MTTLLNRVGVEFVRVAAVDKEAISDAEFQELVAPKPDRWSALTRGELACFLSHRHCLELIAAGEDRYAAILEDDLHLAGNVRDYLCSDAWIPPDADVVKLETGCYTVNDSGRIRINRNGLNIVGNRKLFRIHSTHLGTGFYVVSREFCRRVLSRMAKYEESIDVLIFDNQNGLADSLTIYQMLPAPGIQDSVRRGPKLDALKSTLVEARDKVLAVGRDRPPAKLRGIKKLRRELWRPFKQLARGLLSASAILIDWATSDLRWIDAYQFRDSDFTDAATVGDAKASAKRGHSKSNLTMPAAVPVGGAASGTAPVRTSPKRSARG